MSLEPESIRRLHARLEAQHRTILRLSSRLDSVLDILIDERARTLRVYCQVQGVWVPHADRPMSRSAAQGLAQSVVQTKQVPRAQVRLGESVLWEYPGDSL